MFVRTKKLASTKVPADHVSLGASASDGVELAHQRAEHASARYALSFILAYVTNERMPRQNLPTVRLATIATLPYPPNPYFTGREKELQELHSWLTRQQGAVIDLAGEDVVAVGYAAIG